MMMNLFSTFDPSTGTMSLNWISSILFINTFKYSFWMTKNNMFSINQMLMKTMYNELNLILKNKKMKLFMLSLFYLILTNNLMGLLPYVFTSSSHLIFALSMSLPMWMSFMLFGWVENSKMMLCHLVPIGTPNMLMPLMVMIEITSNIIRPLSLAIRLAANMIAGHLMMTLLGSNLSFIMMLMLMMMFLLLMTFELSVAIIQSYVYMTLLSLYSKEV